MKILMLLLLTIGCGYFQTKEGNPKAKLSYLKTSDIPIPNKTTPYSKNMCRAKKYIPAYSFVLKGAEFNQKGCIQPLEAWVYDSENDKWVFMDANLVKCCNPLKGFKQLSF